MLVKAYLPDIDKALGIYLPLIVVNCIILGRAEMFASKNGVLDSALDGLGMGLGFTLTLLVMGSIRELLGAGSVFGFPVFDSLFAALGLEMTFEPMTVLITPPGGFFVFGCLMALVIWIETKTNNRIQRKMGCEGCPAHGACSGCDKAEKGGAAA